jgi:hypothetical protein
VSFDEERTHPAPRTGGDEVAVSAVLQRIRTRLEGLPEGRGTHYWLRSNSDEERSAYISANHELIRAAAHDCGLPPEMLAGIAWQEIEGDPRLVDDLAYQGRKIIPGTEDPDKTSMGPLAVQVRRAAEVLGYDPHQLTGMQRRVVMEAVRDPRQNIFIAAEYLAHLKSESEFAGVAPEQLTRPQLQELATRYNGGPYYQVGAAQAYGRAFAENLDAAKDALG